MHIHTQSLLVFINIQINVLPLPHQSSKENDQSEVTKDELDFKQVFQVQLLLTDSVHVTK